MGRLRHHPRLTGILLGVWLLALLAIWPATAAAQSGWGAPSAGWGTGAATANANSSPSANANAKPSANASAKPASGTSGTAAVQQQGSGGWGQTPTWGAPDNSAPPPSRPTKPTPTPIAPPPLELQPYQPNYDELPPIADDYPRTTMLDPVWHTDICAGVGIISWREKATEDFIFSDTDSGLIAYGGKIHTYGDNKVINDHALTSLDVGLELSYVYAQHVGFISTLFFITTSDFEMVQVAPTVRAWIYDAIGFSLTADYRYIHAIIFDFAGTQQIHQVEHRFVLSPGFCIRPVKTENSSAEISFRWLADLGGIVDTFAISIHVNIDFLVMAFDITGIPRPVFTWEDIRSQSYDTLQIIATIGARIYW